MKSLEVPRENIEAFAHRWRVSHLALFGSVLREDFNDASDIDVLVSFEPDSDVDLFDMVQMKNELERLFGRRVDLVEREALSNPYRKREILQTQQVIYAA